MSSLRIGKAFKKVVHSAQEGIQYAASQAKESVSVTLSGKIISAYQLNDHVCYGGPSGLWKVYDAVPKKEGGTVNCEVSVWIFEKKGVHDHRNSKSSGTADFIDQQKQGVTMLTKLRHPSILKLIEPLEETRGALLFVSERVVCCVSDYIADYSDLPNTPVATSIKNELKLSDLEVKHGMIQVANAMHFLHETANLVHRNISPQQIMITASGQWKLSGFGFCIPLNFDEAPRPFRFDDFRNGRDTLSTPSLQYTAPELVHGVGNSGLSATADVFSLGAVVYEVMTKNKLLPVRDVSEYQTHINMLPSQQNAKIPPQLNGILRPMLSISPDQRPPVSSFSSSQYFNEDILLRALRFLDTIRQKDAQSRLSFLSDLSKFYSRFDGRVLKYKVLPALLEEAKEASQAPIALPLVLNLIEQQTPQEFHNLTLPQLEPILAAAPSDMQLLLVQKLPVLAKLSTGQNLDRVVLPVIRQACDGQDPRVQEEFLKQLAGITDQLGYQTLKQYVAPRLHQLCLHTSTAGVRIKALMAMAQISGKLDQDDAEKMCQSVAQITDVDKSAGTIMAVLGLMVQLSNKWGHDLIALKILPILTPLLTARSLNNAQFNQLLKHIRGSLDTVEKKMSGLLASTGAPGAPQSADVNADSFSAQLTKKDMQNTWAGMGPTDFPSKPSVSASTSSKPMAASLTTVPMQSGVTASAGGWDSVFTGSTGQVGGVRGRPVVQWVAVWVRCRLTVCR